MKKLLFILIIFSLGFSIMFFGCNFNMLPHIKDEIPISHVDQQRKDFLALLHLSSNHAISVDTLASYVMNFITSL